MSSSLTYKKVCALILLSSLTILATILYVTPISSALKNSNPIEVKVVRDLDPYIYPGQQTDLMLIIKNREHKAYNIIITESHTFPYGVYMLARIRGFNYTFGDKVTIKPNEAIPLTITIITQKDAGTGSITLTIRIEAITV